MKIIGNITRSWILVSGYDSTELAEVWMFLVPTLGAILNIQHQVSSIQHLSSKNDGLTFYAT